MRYKPTAVIRFVDVRKSFGDREILKGVSFEVRAGEVFFIIGGSGAGKSVLIKHLVGLLAPDAGEIWFEDRELSRLDERAFYDVRKRCAMVFQHGTLFDSLNVVDNVALPLTKHRDLSPSRARARAMELLGQVQMSDFAERRPAELGDGLRKRVAIARALALEPSAVLFDEPTTSLDPVSARRVDALIRKLARELGVACLVVSHDLASIFGIADRVVFLYKGELRIVGTPAELRACQDPIVEQFIHGRAEGPIEL